MATVEDSHWWYRSTRALLRQLLGDRLPAGGRYLDLGAGTGATGGWLAARGRLVACDREPMALALNRERHQLTGVVTSDIGTLPFANETFDAVLCVTVLYHRLVGEPAVAV